MDEAKRIIEQRIGSAMDERMHASLGHHRSEYDIAWGRQMGLEEALAIVERNT